jgi:L-ascorbate metabolism protein UlaG (beta-lactamase superfamily)
MSTTPNITWLGHATTLIEMNDVRILTDPVLRDRVGFIGRRSESVNRGTLRDIDAVLISHMHHDHLDLPSLRSLGRDTRLIVPAGAQRILRADGFSNVEEMRAGEFTAVDSLSIGATYADHDGFRHPFGPTGDSLGFMLYGEQTVYFAGDTDIFPEMASLSDHIDLALLPIWGCGPTLGEGHLDPQRAAESLQLLEPHAAMPMHWGTFAPLWLNWSQPRYLVDPPHAFKEHAVDYAPGVDIRLVQPGSQLELVH